MRIFPYLILAFLLCGALAVAGCTTSTTSPPPVTATAISLPSIAIDRTDLPDGYVLTMSRVKNESDVSSLARTLGWQAGYVVQYTKSSDPGTVVIHSLAGYPEDSMPDVVEYVNTADRSYADLKYFDIVVTGLGNNSRAFIGYIPNSSEVVAGTTTPASGTLPSAAVAIEGSETATYGQNFVEIVFAKGDILEVIRISGPVIDDKEAIAIAQKAYAKIP